MKSVTYLIVTLLNSGFPIGFINMQSVKTLARIMEKI